MKSENSRMNSTAMNSNVANDNTTSSEHATTVSKPLYTKETTIGKVTYVVSVCQSPQASGTLKEKLRSIILQRAENARMREWQAKRELEMRERQGR